MKATKEVVKKEVERVVKEVVDVNEYHVVLSEEELFFLALVTGNTVCSGNTPGQQIFDSLSRLAGYNYHNTFKFSGGRVVRV